ncbi:uncharacterized protein LOC124819222 isoform X6 [Hydra vulgaris]|uniref:uncharacterized protein LOC124819222 isoform X6 n=1 Tax=Hydra vulgaris TaxID=6087 RepID=UPI001F5F9BB4|nr:uncharacterized protein LOC124819222 isoform X3 [Hydra vulgaris]XP_047146580.1 uncharacterized protein LOC124819222 isoform X3 [Hydra vulgaris]
MSSSEEEQHRSSRSRSSRSRSSRRSKEEPRRSKNKKSKKNREKLLESIVAQQTEILEQQREMLKRVGQLEDKAAALTNPPPLSEPVPTNAPASASLSAATDTSYEAYRVYRRRNRGPTSSNSYRRWAENGGADDPSFVWQGYGRGRGRGRWGGNKHFNFIYK